MTNRQKMDEMIKDLDTKMANNLKLRERNDFLYTLGTIFTGVLGFGLLFGNPWLGVPLMGGAVALHLSKKAMVENSKVSYNALASQKSHLKDSLSKGLDISADAMSKRKSRINKLEKSRKQQEVNLNSTLGTNRFAKALVAGTIALAGFISSPLIALGSLGCVGLKYLSDKKFMDAHKAIEETVATMNNDITDYNIGVRAINNRRARSTASNQRTNSRVPQRTASRVATVQTAPQRTTMSQAAPQVRRYSREDESAVDRYVRSLEGQGENVRGVQKRKI